MSELLPGMRRRERFHFKRHGRNAVVVFPRIGRKKLQATIFGLPSNVLVGASWFVNDDGERELHIGVGLALVEMTFWTYEPLFDLTYSDESGTPT